MRVSERILWFREFPQGRFANAAYEFLFMKYAERKLGCKLVFGERKTTNWYLPAMLLDLRKQDESITDMLKNEEIDTIKFKNFSRRKPQEDIEEITRYFDGHLTKKVLNIEGHFQYDTASTSQDPDYTAVLEDFGPRLKNGNPFQKHLANYLQQIDALNKAYLIGLHVRRGDYVEQGNKPNKPSPFYPIDLATIAQFLKDYLILNKINDAVLYVASDDISFCKDFFTNQGIAIITRDTLFGNKKATEIDELMLDIAVLTKARVLIASNSTFSMLASMLNKVAKVSLRQTPAGRLIPFDPTNSVLLYGIEEGNPPSG